MGTFEHVVFSNSRGKALVGHFYPGSREACVIVSHGFLMDKTGGGRFNTLFETIYRAGFGVLLFDYSGCGESDPDTITVEKQVDDLYAAIEFVEQQGCQDIGLFGHSLGSLICLYIRHPAVKAMALLGAITGPVKSDLSKYMTRQQQQELQEQGYFTERRMSSRRTLMIDQQLWRTVETLNQEQLLTGLVCPVLFIHGDQGEEENVLYQYAQKAQHYLNPVSDIQMVPGADHSFSGHIPRVGPLVAEWFERHILRKMCAPSEGILS